MQVRQDFQGYFREHVKFDFTLESVKYEAQFVEKQVDLIEQLTDIQTHKEEPILEIGSGLGRLYYILSSRGYRKIQGIEPDNEVCEFANKIFGAKFKNTYLEDLGAAEHDKYRTIFSFETLEHLPNPIESIEKIYQLLDGQGQFIGTSPFPSVGNILSDQTHLFVLHPQNWERLFRRAGFKQVIVRPMTFIPFLWRFSGKLNFILPFYFPYFKFVSTTLIIATK